MNEPAHLLAHGLDDARRTVAQQTAAPAGKEIEVAIARVVPDVRALAAHQADRIARVVADDVLLIQLQRGSVHVNPLRGKYPMTNDQIPKEIPNDQTAKADKPAA